MKSEMLKTSFEPVSFCRVLLKSQVDRIVCYHFKIMGVQQKFPVFCLYRLQCLIPEWCPLFLVSQEFGFITTPGLTN